MYLTQVLFVDIEFNQDFFPPVLFSYWVVFFFFLLLCFLDFAYFVGGIFIFQSYHRHLNSWVLHIRISSNISLPIWQMALKNKKTFYNGVGKLWIFHSPVKDTLPLVGRTINFILLFQMFMFLYSHQMILSEK